MAVDWPHLPPELLETISKNLTIYADYLRFRCVCWSRRSSSPKTPKNLPPQLPWLILPHSHGHHLPNHAVLPQPSRSFPSQAPLCGSSHGWLVILDEGASGLLLNPLTRYKFLSLLPPLSSFPNEFALRSSIGKQYTLSLRQICDSFIKKVVLSSSPLKPKAFVALAILNQNGDLAFCKGDQSWSFIDAARSYSEDVVFFDGLFYAVNKYGAVAVCDVRNSPAAVDIIKTPRQVDADMQYLVHRSVGFDVFRMDWGGPRWVKVNDLSDRMLFIGQNSSLSVSASRFPGCIGNCIYFTDDYSVLNHESAFGERDSGVYRLSDGKIEGKWNSRCRDHWPTPVWVSPNSC